jgi:undecaprenyl-diphosphatase
VLRDWHTISQNFTPRFLLVGISMAFVFSIFTIKMFFNFLGAKGMRVFAWYRILLGLAILILFA